MGSSLDIQKHEKHNDFWLRFGKTKYTSITNTMQLMLHRISHHEDEQLEALKKENAELKELNGELVKAKESVKGLMVKGHRKDIWGRFKIMSKREVESLSLDDVLALERQEL